MVYYTGKRQVDKSKNHVGLSVVTLVQKKYDYEKDIILQEYENGNKIKNAK